MPAFPFTRRRRRERIVRDSPVPGDLWNRVIPARPVFDRLGAADLALLREHCAVFLAEKIFRAVKGAATTPELELAVAAQACLPLLGLDIGWYDGWSTIIVLPDWYSVDRVEVDEAGVVHEYEDEFAGESFDLGPVALSVADIAESGYRTGYNVVIHEMAHKIDGRDGSCDGCPPLHRDMDPASWKRAFSEAYGDFRRRVETSEGRKRAGLRGGSRKRSRIDPYAAERPDEFFAVLCEEFFERPHVVAGEYPEVFEQLAAFFRRRPALPG